MQIDLCRIVVHHFKHKSIDASDVTIEQKHGQKLCKYDQSIT